VRNRTLVRVIAAVLLIALVLSMGVAAMAQEGRDSPVGEIIPKPDSGEAPEEAGDRGGSLQVALLGLIAVGVAGMAVYVSRQSTSARADRLERARRAADERASAVPQPSASQAATPPRNPDR
jgi:hypothetical protein